ncbi:MAG: signal peptidase I [Hyphomicrobiales bacterium]
MDEANKKSEGGTWEIIRVIIQALIIAFFVRTFLYQPFNIPSGSMVPTLLIGDYLFVSKLSYGYSRYTFSFNLSAGGENFLKIEPFSFDGRVFFAEQPKRGDVAVFKLPTDNETDYIKRVVGLPGDRVQMIDSLLHINGKPVGMRKVSPPTGKLPYGTGSNDVKVFVESLPNGVEYNIYDQGWQRLDDTKEFVVPEDHFFMMGDNRDNSRDSRDSGVGYVPIENFVGRADIIFFSITPNGSFWQFWRWPQTIRWSRLLQTVK